MQSLGSISHSVPRRMERLRMKKIKQTTICGQKKGLLLCRGRFPNTNRREAHEWDRVNFLCSHRNAGLLPFWKNKSSVHPSSRLLCQIFPKFQWHRSKGKSQAGFLGPSLREFLGFTLHVNEVWTSHYLLVNKPLATCGLIWEGEHFFRDLKMVFGWLWGSWIFF